MRLICLIFFLVLQVPSRDLPIVDRDQLLHDVQILSADDMEGREVDTPGSAKARTYILERFKQVGIQPFNNAYEQTFTFQYRKQENKHTGVNIVGMIPGSSAERMIVLTAHYDHLGIRKGLIYNGADDNASGVAALFTIGSHFKKHVPQNTLIVAALDAEEGSGGGGEKLVESLNKQKIVLNVNLDMIGRDENNILYASGTYHYPHLKPILEKVAAKAGVKLLFGHDNPKLKHVEDWTKESDHYAFHRLRIPFIYFGVEDYEHHHKPTDDFENMTHDFYVRAVQTIILALQALDLNF